MKETDEQLMRMLSALAAIRCPAVCEEAQLHTMVLDALAAAGFCPEHEVRIAPRCRIDVLCEGVGIEIKKSRPQPAALLRQLTRYAESDAVQTLLVIAPRGVNLPKRIGGKSVTFLALERLWGISLP